MIFRNWVLQNFPFLEDDFDALTDYELFCKMVEYMKKSLEKIEGFRKDIEAFNKELDDFKSYFDNLNVQEEINNKLDEMAESGQLEEIIAQYLNLTSLFTFNNIDEMIASEDLINNSKVVVYGTNDYKDGGFKIFIIKDTTDLVVDNEKVFELNNGKYAIVVNESIFKNSVDYNRFRYENTNCFIVNVSKYDKYKNRNIFKIGIANDYVGDDHKESTMHFAQRKNATICTNAGVFNLDPPYQIWGACIINGEIVVNNPVPEGEGFYYFTIDDDGHFGYVDQDVSPATMIANGVKNAILGCFPLIVDGNIFSHGEHYLDGLHPRLIYCENFDGSQFIFACEGRLYEDVGLDFTDIQTYLMNNYPNIKFAMALDGGGSLSVNVYKQKLNISLDDNLTTDREVPYFIYLANENATNTEQDDLNIILNTLSEQVYHLQTELNTLKNLYTRDLNIISDDLYPHINAFTNGDTSQYTGRMTFERGGFSVQSTNGSNENPEYMITASRAGITGYDGLLGMWLKGAKLITDCNATDLKSGLYYTNDSSLNAANPWCPVLYLNLENTNNIIEIFIPTTRYAPILMRRYNGSTWGDLYSNMACSTGDRSNAYLGVMMFDTTLGKPIWYNGSNWVDATGTQV